MISAGENLGEPGAHADDADLNRQRPVRFYIAAAAIAFFLALTFRPYSNVTAFFLHRQDRWLLLIGAGLMALSFYRLSARARLPDVRWRTALAVSAALLLVTLAGHYVVLAGYDMSRDEQMASFDAIVFGHGHLVEHLPVLWHNHADALDTNLMYPADHRGAWISIYLPLNSALRALIGIVATPYLCGALMTGLGAFALWGCVRRLWPDDREVAFVALALYAGSGQIIVTGMTSYAMPDHLAFNLCWLWLFLQGRRGLDMVALVVGFVSTGLHQPLMHMMFVAPIMLLVLRDRQWARAALYFIGYAAIGVFWLWWPTWIWSLIQTAPDTLVQANRPAGIDFMTRLVMTLRSRDPMGLPNMVANLLRFVAWQHLLLMPLLVIGVRLANDNRMVAALVAGMILTTLFMAVALPYQGHGFGYRYLHGLIGNGILVAIYGWKSIGETVGRWRTLALRTTAASVIVLMPVQAIMAHAFYAPAAAASARIDTITADYAVIGKHDVPYAVDLINNPPALDRKPVRLVREALDDDAIAAICASRPSVALVGNGLLARSAAYYGFGLARADSDSLQILPRLIRAGCAVRTAN